MASQDLKKIENGEMESEGEEDKLDIRIRKGAERVAKRREEWRQKWKSTEMEEMYPEFFTKKHTLIERKSNVANEEESISEHDSRFDQEYTSNTTEHDATLKILRSRIFTADETCMIEMFIKGEYSYDNSMPQIGIATREEMLSDTLTCLSDDPTKKIRRKIFG